MEAMMKCFVCVALVFISGLTIFSAENSLKTITFESLSTFPSPQAIELSPDGRQLLYSTYQIDSVTGSYTGGYHLMSTEGKKSRLLPQGIQSARWMPDSRTVTYISYQNGEGQLFKMDLISDQSDQLSHVPGGISDYLCLPDGSGILYTASVFAADQTPEYAATMAEEKKQRKHSGKTYDHLLMRPYSRWDDGKVSHIFLYRFDSKEILDLTPGPYEAPTSHLGGQQDLAISPDGRTVAYTCNTDEVQAVSTNNDIFLVDLNGQNHRRLTQGKGNDAYPVFSPDGRYLAYTEMATPGYESEQKDLIVVDLKNDHHRNLTSDLDLPVGDIVWSKDCDALIISCKEKGYDALYRIRISDGQTSCLVRDRIFSNLVMTIDEKAFFCTTSSLDRPAEIARFDLRKQKFTVFTHLADEFVKTYALGKSEVVWFKGGNGDQVMAFVTLPPNFDAKQKYPLLFLIHGGPEGDWDGGWSNYVGNVHHYASARYIVVKVNLHAATSYGRKFHEAILNNWGIVDQADMDGCIDYLCSARPCIDQKRIGAIGRSYGGFLVNWLNGNSDRFSCFVSIDGLFDQLMFYYSTDELWFPEKEFGGTPYQNRAEYLRASPSTYVHHFKTPTLVLHGGHDFRVDLSQGIGMYTALKRQGVDSRLIVFPEEGHYYRSQHNWKYAYDEIFAWLEKYLKNK